jgi:hypothetical protein
MMAADYDKTFCGKPRWMFGRGWYLAICIVIILGYTAGGLLPFGIQYLGYLPDFPDPARFVLTLFGVGMLGATMHCNYFFAHDANMAMYSPALKQPNFVDPFLYAMGIVGGGVTGLLLVLAVKAGFLLAVSSSVGSEMRFSSAILVSFCGGLATYRVRALFARFVETLDPKKDSEASLSPDCSTPQPRADEKPTEGPQNA